MFFVAHESEALIEPVRSRKRGLQVAERPRLIRKFQHGCEQSTSETATLNGRLDANEGEVPMGGGGMELLHRREPCEEAL